MYLSQRAERPPKGEKQDEPARDPASNQIQEFYKTHGHLGSATTSAFNPIPYPDASLTVGKDGPILLEDWVLLDELSHFNRERVPERVVHAKGSGARGTFVVTHDITKYTVAKPFESIGKITPLSARFSTVAGNLGAADTVRDPRGFAVKFFTEDGIWDLVGNNTPIFFIRDPIMFPRFIHSQKRNPVTNMRDWDVFWDFISLRPETTHQIMITFSDRGIPDGFRHMHGYGSHTFALINKDKERTYCKFHWKTNQGIQNIPVARANKLAGEEPDYGQRDLYNSIASNDFPKWTLYIQTMSEAEAESNSFTFDVTKVWPQKDYPLQQVGCMTLDKNPANYFAEIEQAAYSPANFIPGIMASRDRMLQGRLFAYHDAHIYRIGANYNQLVPNNPYRARNFQRDAHFTIDSQGGAPNYHPNSFGGPDGDKRAQAHYKSYTTHGEVGRYDTRDEDNFSQPANFYRKVLNEEERARLIDNICGDLKKASMKIQERTVDMFTKVDADFGARIAKGLKPKRTMATV